MFIENLPALMILFGTTVLVAVGAVLMAGFVTTSSSSSFHEGRLVRVLVLLTGVALVGCGASLLVWSLKTLPVSWAIIAAGLGLLSGPLIFQMLPGRFADRPIGLICIAGLSSAIGFSLQRFGTV